jgi:hypothetical protein
MKVMKEVAFCSCLSLNLLMWFFLPEAVRWLGGESPVSLSIFYHSPSKRLKIALLMIGLYLSMYVGVTSGTPLGFALGLIAGSILSAVLGLLFRAIWSDLVD